MEIHSTVHNLNNLNLNHLKLFLSVFFDFRLNFRENILFHISIVILILRNHKLYPILTDLYYFVYLLTPEKNLEFLN